MKLNDIKHNHSLTELLKVLIFSLLMLAPLFASVSQMLYATFNKNAYQSYSDNKVEEVVTINENTFIDNTLYTYQYSQENNSNGVRTEYSYISLSATDLNVSQEVYESLNHIFLYAGNLIYFSNDDNSRRYSYTLTDDMFKSFGMITSYQNNLTTTFKVLLTTYEQQKLDNAFYYGVEQMTKSDLFNWTQNTAIYNGINTMTSQLGIQTSAIPILLTYWFLLTIIYVIIDIILKAFTTITHMLQKK